MAEATKPSATAISTMNAGADAKDAPEAKQTASRPTKPDDAAFQAALDTANKNFDKAKQRVVSVTPRLFLLPCCLSTNLPLVVLQISVAMLQENYLCHLSRF